MSNHTPGNWQLGKTGGTVVTDVIPDNALTHTGHADKEYYGGYLIAESVLSMDDAKLIAAAPTMKKQLEQFAMLNENHPDFRAIAGLIISARQILTQLD